MRKMLFLLWLLPVFAAAQRDEYDIAFEKSIPDSLVNRVHMPAIDYNPDFNYEDSFNYKQKTRVYIVDSDSIYRKFFWRYVYTEDSIKKYRNLGNDDWWLNWMKQHHVDSVPNIDFSKQELVLYSACGQCLAYCREEACHRNACSWNEAWFIRDKSLVTKHKLTRPCTPIILPVLNKSDLAKYFEIGRLSGYNYTVANDSIYYGIFAKHSKTSLPIIDFSTQELVVSIYCAQCAALCGGNRPCHRNACMYKESWCLREKSSGN